MKENYEYPNQTYSLGNADGKKIKEKITAYFKLGNHQVLTISCLI